MESYCDFVFVGASVNRLGFGAIAALPLLLSACVSSGGADAIHPIASSVSANSFVQQVVVTDAPANVRPEFKDVFAKRALAKLNNCAHGNKPLRLDVAVADFHQSNGAKTYLIGDANRIRGTAKLVDPSDGSVVAEYDFNRSVGGGGLIAAVAMSHGQEQLADAVGDEICKQAFIAR